MNITLLPSSFHPHVGGVEEMTRQLALQLRADGHNPLIITNRWPKDLPAEETLDGILVKRFVFRVPEHNWKQLGGSLLYGPRTLREVTHVVRDHRTDVLHVHCVSSNAHYALAVKRTLGVPLIVTTHAELTMDATNLFQNSRFAQNLMRRALNEADYVTACAAHTLHDAERFLAGSLAYKSRVIYNGAPALEDVAPFAHPRPFILAMGRLVPQKGFDLLIQAFNEIRSVVAPLREPPDLLIAGDGPERAVLETLKNSLPTATHITLLGNQTRPQVHALLKAAACFVLPSRTHEGMPMVLLEALAAAKPIIATRSGGTEELLADAALLVERENAEALTAAMHTLLTDSNLRRTLSVRAAGRAADFQWSHIAGQYTAIYTDLVNHSHSKQQQLTRAL